MNTNSPFTPFQQDLILWAAGLAVLMAVRFLLKAYHPRWRPPGQVRYSPLAFAVLLIVCAADFVVFARAVQVIAHHPFWAIVPPMLASAAAAVASSYDQARAKASAPAKPPAQGPAPRLSEHGIMRLAIWDARLLALSLATTLVSLYGQLFGPKWPILFGVTGFLLAFATLVLAGHPLGRSFLAACPQGLSGRFPRLQRFQLPLAQTLKITGLCAFLSIALLFAVARTAGVPSDSLPVFAPRQNYVLVDHGRRTEVSALRFWVASGAGLTGWHLGTGFASLLALYGLLFGKFPAEFVNRKGRSGAAE